MTTRIYDFYISSPEAANTFASALDAGSEELLTSVLVGLFGYASTKAGFIAGVILAIDTYVLGQIASEMRDEVINNHRAINLTITKAGISMPTKSIRSWDGESINYCSTWGGFHDIKINMERKENYFMVLSLGINFLDSLVLIAATIFFIYLLLSSSEFTYKTVLNITTFLIELSIYIYILIYKKDLGTGHLIFVMIFMFIIKEWGELHINKKNIILYRIIMAIIYLVISTLVYVFVIRGHLLR